MGQRRQWQHTLRLGESVAIGESTDDTRAFLTYAASIRVGNRWQIIFHADTERDGDPHFRDVKAFRDAEFTVQGVIVTLLEVGERRIRICVDGPRSWSVARRAA